MTLTRHKPTHALQEPLSAASIYPSSTLVDMVCVDCSQPVDIGIGELRCEVCGTWWSATAADGEIGSTFDEPAGQQQWT